ncbi:MAG TPA: hypothetical protein VFY38_02195 [Pseudonocardia sp.]|nr:hypothetical protein [Pseudonocardia sp.]
MAESIGVAPDAVRRLDGSEATELAALAAVFDDLQYALRCCEHLVGALARPEADAALVEALWTGALLAYARCFSGRTKIVADGDLAELKLDGDVVGFHRALLRLRDHYASRHANPRETFTVGVAQGTNGTAAGVAVVGAQQPAVDDTTVRQLGRIAYGLSALVDARMQVAQQKVHVVAQELDAARLAALPLVDVQVPA